MRLALGTVEQRAACPGLLETLGALRAIPPTQLQEEAFISQVGISQLVKLNGLAHAAQLGTQPR